MKSIKKLCYEAKWGKLTPEEITHVGERLKNHKTGDADILVDLIYILGYSGADEYRDLVEKFLYYREDLYVCQQTLKTLCTCWALTEEYLDAVKMYIRGAEWDDTDDVRLSALFIAGNYLRKKKFDRELLHLLLEVFEDLGTSKEIYESRDYARSLVKGWAYDAIARAMGKDYEEILPDDDVEELIETGQLELLDQEMLQKARLLAQKY